MKKRFCLVVIGLLTVFNQAFSFNHDDRLLLIEKGEETREPRLSYKKAYEHLLFVTSSELARYFFSPASKEPEMTAAVYQAVSKKGGLPGGYWITATKASRRIFDQVYGKAIRDGRAIGITKHEAPLPEATAIGVHRVWLQMLLDARPRNKLEMGLDSEIVIFSARNENGRELRARLGKLEGKSQEIVRLSDELIEFAAAPARERAMRLRIIEDLVRSLGNQP